MNYETTTMNEATMAILVVNVKGFTDEALVTMYREMQDAYVNLVLKPRMRERRRRLYSVMQAFQEEAFNRNLAIGGAR